MPVGFGSWFSAVGGRAAPSGEARWHARGSGRDGRHAALRGRRDEGRWRYEAPGTEHESEHGSESGSDEERWTCDESDREEG